MVSQGIHLPPFWYHKGITSLPSEGGTVPRQATPVDVVESVLRGVATRARCPLATAQPLASPAHGFALRYKRRFWKMLFGGPKTWQINPIVEQRKAHTHAHLLYFSTNVIGPPEKHCPPESSIILQSLARHGRRRIACSGARVRCPQAHCSSRPPQRPRRGCRPAPHGLFLSQLLG